MDQFHEESVRKEKVGFSNLVYVLAYILMIISGFMALMSLQIVFTGQHLVQSLIETGIFGALTYGLYVLKNNQRIEYDYTFTNGIFDVAKVINNSKRKKLLSVNVKEFEVVAPISDEGFERMLHHKNIDKKYNVFLNKGSRLYYGIFNHEGTKSMIVFEPGEEMIKIFKVFNPRAVKIG